ncbi:hypothetical protein [Streptomyces sp. NBC_00443]|uniref:hypothetical protein n=1 Tax=Streptomyces sp. NBC_00443 TaxID=2975743 RepID=UPI002E239515
MGEQIPSCACDDNALPDPAARVHPGECTSHIPKGDRVGVARSYLTPDAQWHTIWRTLANPGE